MFSVSVAFLANGNRNSPGLSSCYGLGLDGAQLVSGKEPLGSPGREVTGGASFRGDTGGSVVFSSGRVQVSLSFFINDVFMFRRGKAR